MCLWCCWTSKDAETSFEKSTPRARRVSAPMRVQGLLERRDEDRGRVIDATDASVMCRDDSSFIDRQDRGARRFGHITDCPGFGGTEVAEPATWGMIKGGPKSGQSGNEVDHTPTWPSPGFQATDKRISSLRDAIGGIVSEGDLRQRRREWAQGCDMGDRANLSRKEKPKPEPMSSMQSLMTPARRSGMKTIGDVSANDSGVLVCRMSQFDTLPLLLHLSVLPHSRPFHDPPQESAWAKRSHPLSFRLRCLRLKPRDGRCCPSDYDD